MKMKKRNLFDGMNLKGLYLTGMFFEEMQVVDDKSKFLERFCEVDESKQFDERTLSQVVGCCYERSVMEGSAASNNAAGINQEMLPVFFI